MAIYSFPSPCAPKHKKPMSVEDCLPNAKIFAKKQHGRAAMGPVKRGDQVLIVTYPDQDKYVKEALIQALEEEGAEKVDFVNEQDLTGKESVTRSVENGWIEADFMAKGEPGTEETPFVEEYVAPVRKYLDKHPEYTDVFLRTGGRGHTKYALRQHGHKFKNNWVFNNWEEFFSKIWTYPEELWKEIERPVVEALGKASKVRITDPEGTYLEYSLTEEEATRWQMCSWVPGHIFLDPLQATSDECSRAPKVPVLGEKGDGRAVMSSVPVSLNVPPIFHNPNGVLAGTANHQGFLPRIELYFEEGLLVEVKGGGKYGDIIREMMEKYKDVHFPPYPRKGFFWFCDSALCTLVKAFRRTSDMFNCYWQAPNIQERNRAGVFHHGFGTRRHGEAYVKYVKEKKIVHSHIHIHNYFTTYEIKLRGTEEWLKITDRGRLTSLDDPKIRALAVKYGDPDELLSYEWVPPLPGINCEGDYFKDYAPDPMAYLKKRMKEDKTI